MTSTTRIRTEFIGAHVEPSTKLRLVRTAWRQNKSVSAFVDEAVKEKLLREQPQNTPTPGLQEAS